MPISDIQLVFQWWAALFLVGVAAFPLTKRLFTPWSATRLVHRNLGEGGSLGEGWHDKGYFFSKAVGMAVVTYIVFLLGTLHIAPFTIQTVVGACIGVFGLGVCFQICNLKFEIFNKNFKLQILNFRKGEWKDIGFFIVEEGVFFAALLAWSWVKAHEPSIRGLEKFMDFGFMQILLNSPYFPAPDMWWAGGTINYYFFGHLVTAVLTKLSGLDLAVTFNLMLATLFALTLTMSFSIGYQLSQNSKLKTQNDNVKVKSFIAGILTSFLVTLAGNMQTIYAFTKGYVGENVVPFWTILWSPAEFFSKLGEGMERYWYANATRFIPFTIHEFPSYSFVVSDVHGHVLSIPFVLLAIALLIQLFSSKYSADPQETKRQGDKEIKIFGFLNLPISQSPNLIFYGFLLGVLLMTNALDGPIYGLLFVSLIVVNFKFQISNFKLWKRIFIPIVIVAITTMIIALPFLVHFSSFASGIGVNCPPSFLANTKIGPFLFEGVEKCQKSPLWMMELLWGFFWYCGIWLFIKRVWKEEQYNAPINRILKVFFLFSLFLITIPEFFYVKDIYPAHFRSNTMFKLGYEAFILWSIIAGYVIVHFIFMRRQKTIRTLFFLLLIPQLFLVSIYPIFSVRSYFGELKTYRGIYGLSWLESEYPSDFQAIQWLKEKTMDNEQGTCKKEYQQMSASFAHCLMSPGIVEADGDSYTDYNHVSAFAGVPTIVGWAVHEWLWRGSYDIVAPRREDVRLIYESGDPDVIRPILETYHTRYILVGKLEREKFKQLHEDVIARIGTVAFQSGDTVVYEVKR